MSGRNIWVTLLSMAARTKTGFDRYFDDRMKAPAFAAEYRQARAEIDAVDTLIRALDEARERSGLTKAGSGPPHRREAGDRPAASDRGGQQPDDDDCPEAGVRRGLPPGARSEYRSPEGGARGKRGPGRIALSNNRAGLPPFVLATQSADCGVVLVAEGGAERLVQPGDEHEARSPRPTVAPSLSSRQNRRKCRR